MSRYRLAGSPPDVLVTIPATDVRTMDFHRAESMISLGRSATTRALAREDQEQPAADVDRYSR